MEFSFLSVLILALVLACVALFVAALASIMRSPAPGTEKAIWVLITLMFPFMGPVVWFVFGPRSGRPDQGLTGRSAR